MAGHVSTGSAAVLLVGLSFRSAPVTVLEQVSTADTDLPKLEQVLLDSEVLSEALVLSTCNRMEFYTVANAFHPGLDHIVETISNYSGLDSGDLEPHLYVHYSDAAAEHMLNVASGLDSMVLGEQQIIGQLRGAYQESKNTGTVGRTLHDLTQRALRTGKRVHSETNIDAAGASMVTFAVDRALGVLGIPDAKPGVLQGHRAVVIGAGAMASLASTHLGRLGVDHVTVANRTVDRAQQLASHAVEAGVSAEGIGLNELPGALTGADIVVSATGAVGTVVSAADLRAAQQVRQGKQQVLVDLSMPRDIEQAAAEVPGVALLNIEELTTMTVDSIEDEDSARAIVSEELMEFLEEQRAQAVVPTVKALRQQAMDALSNEQLALERQTPNMSDQDREAVNRSMRRIVEKLLHTPTVQAKKLSAGGQSVSYPDALAALFNLPTGTGQSVSSVKGAAAGSGLRTGKKPGELNAKQAAAPVQPSTGDKGSHSITGSVVSQARQGGQAGLTRKNNSTTNTGESAS